jgi:hypothetical protein
MIDKSEELALNKLEYILKPAYLPCEGFNNGCNLCWNPNEGHIPRGFLGATSTIRDVEIIMVFAEPGDPHKDEKYESASFKSALNRTYKSMKDGTDRFHENVRSILNMFFPGEDFDAQLKKTWMTESVLCSASKECGSVPKEVIEKCSNNYLLKQISLFFDGIANPPTIIALGRKASVRLDRLKLNEKKIPFIYVAHPSPPGANRKEAVISWKKAAEDFKLAKSHNVDKYQINTSFE